MDHRAHTIRSGWKNSRMSRAWSVSRPKASVPVTYCEMLPGKIATKNAATIQPTGTRYRGRAISASPRAISTTPEATTTKSGSRGSHVGTWAWNSSRWRVR